MYPVLLGEGEWALPSYFTMLMVGFFVGVALLRRQAMQAGWDLRKVVDLALILLVAGVAGARLFHVLFDGYLMDYVHLCTDPLALAQPLPDGTSCTSDAMCLAAQGQGHDIGAICHDAGPQGRCVPERDCLRALKFWSGGLTYYGGFLLALLAAWWTTRRWRWSLLHFADLAAPSVALGLVFGRLGCFLAGCCFGAPCAGRCGVTFPVGSDAWRLHRESEREALVAQYQATGEWSSLPVHPTQLYEAGAMLLVFVGLWFWLRPRRRFHGESLGWLLLSYGVIRFVVEWWRADMRGALWLFSTSQWLSLPLVVLGLWLLLRQGRVAVAPLASPPSGRQET